MGGRVVVEVASRQNMIAPWRLWTSAALDKLDPC